MAARAAEASLSPAEKARADLEKLKKRLEKSEGKLAESREAGDEEKIIIALEATVAKLSEKIAATEQLLSEAQDN